MSTFLIAKDESTKNELIARGYHLVSTVKNTDSNLYYFQNDTKLSFANLDCIITNRLVV